MKRIKTETEARGAEVNLFAIGINDAQYVESQKTRRVEPEEFENNLEKLLNISSSFVGKVIFLSLTPVDESKTCPIPWDQDKFYYNNNVGEYNQIIKEFCGHNNLDFIDVFQIVKQEDLEDGLHPNTEGHKKIFEKVKKYLRENNV